MSVGDAYYERIKEFDKEWHGFDLGKFRNYSEIKDLQEKQRKFQEAAGTIVRPAPFLKEDDLLRMYYELIDNSEAEQIDYLGQINKWSSACASLYKAQNEARYVYEKARSAKNDRVKVVSWVLRAASLLIIAISVASYFI